MLIPSYAAGSIIGKGGQTIVQLQKETGATIKLSKSKDFYPGELRVHLSIPATWALCEGQGHDGGLPSPKWTTLPSAPRARPRADGGVEAGPDNGMLHIYEFICMML